jgi:YHS domain-containing protein
MDPVCGMSVGERLAQGMGLTTQHQGKSYFFCSAKCKQKFDQEPEQHLGKVAGTQDRPMMAKSGPPQGIPGPKMEEAQGHQMPSHHEGQMATAPLQPDPMPATEGTATQTQVNPSGARQPQSKADKEQDPVCGMEVEPAKARAARQISFYKNEVYFFCSNKCKVQFDKKPESYLNKKSGKIPHAQNKPPDAPTGGHAHD